MIFPEDYKCLVCKHKWTYACPHRNNKTMLSCARFQREVVRDAKMVDLAIARCFFGVCSRLVSLKNKKIWEKE